MLAVAAAFAYAAYASFSVNAEHRADPRELLVSTQSSEDGRQGRATRWWRTAERADREGRPFR